jgi:hypothetical protein
MQDDCVARSAQFGMLFTTALVSMSLAVERFFTEAGTHLGSFSRLLDRRHELPESDVDGDAVAASVGDVEAPFLVERQAIGKEAGIDDQLISYEVSRTLNRDHRVILVGAVDVAEAVECCGETRLSQLAGSAKLLVDEVGADLKQLGGTVAAKHCIVVPSRNPR